MNEWYLIDGNALARLELLARRLYVRLRRMKGRQVA